MQEKIVIADIGIYEQEAVKAVCTLSGEKRSVSCFRSVIPAETRGLLEKSFWLPEVRECAELLI